MTPRKLNLTAATLIALLLSLAFVSPASADKPASLDHVCVILDGKVTGVRPSIDPSACIPDAEAESLNVRKTTKKGENFLQIEVRLQMTLDGLINGNADRQECWGGAVDISWGSIRVAVGDAVTADFYPTFFDGEGNLQKYRLNFYFDLPHGITVENLYDGHVLDINKLVVTTEGPGHRPLACTGTFDFSSGPFSGTFTISPLP